MGATVKGPGFTIEMPDKPKRSTSTLQTAKGPVRLTLYLVERGNDEAYIMGAGKMAAGAESDLDGAIAGTAAQAHGTVAERKAFKYQGFPARDARVTDAEDSHGNKATVFIRVIGAGDRFYILDYVTKGADVKTPAAGYQSFLESLKID
jgi:hypothetical protein